MKILAYHNSPEEKEATLAQLREHQRLDEIVQGTYWSLFQNGESHFKGCAVGCLTHDPTGGHDQFPKLWGVPVQLAYLIDQIFESLTVEDSKEWPLRFMSAIPVGADLSRVFDRFNAWMLRDLISISGTSAVIVEQMAVLFERAGVGDEPTATEWQSAAEAARAAWTAWAARASWTAEAAEAARAAARNEWASRAATQLVTIIESLVPADVS